ncbi:MAG: DUF484 family protein [Bdellovibrionales bacterium]
MSFDQPSTATQSLSADEVRAYLLENPDFLEENGDLLNALLPLDPPKGEGIQDFQRYRLAKLQDDFIALKAESEDLMELMQEHIQRQNRMNAAIAAMLDARDFAGLVPLVTHQFAALLEHVGIGFFLEAGGWLEQGDYNGLHVVAPGFVNRWLGCSNSLLEEVHPAPKELFLTHAPLVQSQALVRLTLREGLPPGLLALGHANPMYYATDLATEQVECLGGVLERCLRKFLL